MEIVCENRCEGVTGLEGILDDSLPLSCGLNVDVSDKPSTALLPSEVFNRSIHAACAEL